MMESEIFQILKEKKLLLSSFRMPDGDRMGTLYFLKSMRGKLLNDGFSMTRAEAYQFLKDLK